MKNMLYALVAFLILFWIVPTNASAQGDQPNIYHVLDFMKVKAGMEADYVAIEKVWKKIHQAKVKAGRLGDWALLAVASPFGENCEYNYVTRNTYIGDDQLVGHYEDDFFPENWESLLTDDEVELINKTLATRSLVKEEVWSNIDGVFPEDLSDVNVVVFNYFKLHEGKTQADHIKVERDVWKPVHQARFKDGKMKGWILLGLALPMGTNQVYTEATVDFYTSMKDLMDMDLPGYFEKVHTGKDVNEMMNKIGTVVDRADAQIWMVVDKLESEDN